MKNSRKLLAILLITVFTISSLSLTSFAAGTISVKLDGKALALSAKPIQKNGEVLIPIKSIAEAIGGSATLDSTKKVLTVKTADKTSVFTLNSKKAVVNGVSKDMKVAVATLRGTFMVPLNFLENALGAKATYSSNVVSIKYFTNLTGILKVGGSTTIQQYAQNVADKLLSMNKNVSITVSGGGSGAGINGVADGTFNIGNASRDLKAAEKEKNPDLKSYMIGKDAIVIIVNKSNPVKSLTKDQIKKIFTGAIVNWKEVGGNDAPILLQTREEGSGTLDGMVSLALGGDKVASTATPLSSNALVREAVKSNANAVGFLSMGYVNSAIDAVKVEGVTATAINSMTGKYPYVRNLNVVSKGQPTELAAKYINFMLSPEGQKLLSDEAYLPLKLKD